MAIIKTIASHNGLQATEQAYEALQQGKSPLAAVVAGVTLVEDDPQERTVGYGGLPNEQGAGRIRRCRDGRSDASGGWRSCPAWGSPCSTSGPAVNGADQSIAARWGRSPGVCPGQRFSRRRFVDRSVASDVAVLETNEIQP